MTTLEGKTALITGGTSGIGLATARLFRQAGARVAITGRDGERLAAVRAEFGDDSLVVRSEAGSIAEIESLLGQVEERFGRLDVLFLNAAATHPASIDAVTEAQFDEVVAANFKGPFFTIQKALPLFGGNASVIVNTSIVNRTGSPKFSIYGASKAALGSLVQSLGLALIGRGIRVNAVCPGPVDTGGFRRLKVPADTLRSITGEIAGRSPIGRFATPDEIAKVVLFLASDDSAYVVGEEIVVDGGISHVCLP